MPGVSAPIELGAEFIHGRPDVTLRLLKQSGTGAIDSVRESRYVHDGALVPINAFAEAQRALRGARLSKDVSFATLLARRRIPARSRTFAQLMVQGFDAADPARVSARSIVEEWGSGGSMGASQPRPSCGYGPLLDALASRAFGAGARLRLQAIVREIRWRADAVEVEGDFTGKRFVERAQRVIVTLPLGVLQSRTVRFRPAPRGKLQALGRLASGPVVKAALRFDEPFWEGRAPGVAFFHAPRAPFPTFWTPLPARVPMLVAWAGGPKAERLSGRSESNLVAEALRGLRSIFGRIPSPGAVLVHDWRSDPFARGAYSYLRVGGEGAREDLATPIANTLFFAGEATDAEESGTVAGALRSGERAAREVLEAQ